VAQQVAPVLEGNRVLAAVKLLIDEKLRRKIGPAGIPSISKDLSTKSETLPVIKCYRKQMWDYVGFKHVNGPQDWDMANDRAEPR
jgi:hypothetical protein